MKFTDSGTKNRRLKNYLLYPKVQVKYAILYSILIVLLGSFLIALQVVSNHEVIKHIDSPETGEMVAHIQNRNLMIQACIFVLSSALLFLITITMTHRFLGPIVAIIRHFETLRLHGSAKPIVLRREDELEPLITYLQSVDIKVSEKQEEKKS